VVERRIVAPEDAGFESRLSPHALREHLVSSAVCKTVAFGLSRFDSGDAHHAYRVLMSETLEQLRTLSDDELVQRHDKHANNTGVGTKHYLDELDRRSRERSAQAAEQLARDAVTLARRTYQLTWASVSLAAVAVVIAVASIWLS
jgi:hypothetical protein